MPKGENPDVLILGTGIAGLSAAVSMAEKGLEVLILTKAEQVEDSNTRWAQGGIVGRGEKDSPELLMKDILRAGGGLNYEESVRVLAAQGPGLVDSLLREKIKTPFVLDEKGRPSLGREGAHSVRRIYHWMDRTGEVIEKSLYDYAKTLPGIKIETERMAVDLITNCHHSLDPQERYRGNRIVGAYVLYTATGEVLPVLAPVVVLATGGLGHVFRHTSNPPVATGDGIAMAYRAGVTIVNAEYVQFHPTTLYHRDYPNFLISEALRGEGARLINRRGEAFMGRYHPELKDLAPRDEVARGIYKEMEFQGDVCVFLDAGRIQGLDLPARFPAIYETCRKADIDIRKDPIPVVPAAHYFNGGIKADLGGRTSLPGLYAVGETACTGVHGANRLASVSLLEGLYTGTKLGETALKEIRPLKKNLINDIPPWISPEEAADPVHIHNDLESVQVLMWNYVGIVRTKRRLERALADLNYLNHRIDRFYRKARPSRSLVEMRNAALSATVITRAAMMNNKSQGSHWLEDL